MLEMMLILEFEVDNVISFEVSVSSLRLRDHELDVLSAV